MRGSKCPNCAKKIQKDFLFCPNCAFPIKKQSEKEKFGLIGKDDSINQMSPDMGLPISGIDKILHGLMSQLGKELNNMNGLAGQSGRNFKIQISTAIPHNMTSMKKHSKNKRSVSSLDRLEIPVEEIERRKSLPRREAESNVRRFSDRIIYEIKIPGVNNKEQIVITKLDNSYEIKAYSKEECYTKSIPINADMIQSYIKEGTLFLELKE